MDNAEADFKIAQKELEKAQKLIERIENAQNNMKSESPYCSFCGNGYGKYKHLIEGRLKAKICDVCIAECSEILVTMEKEKGDDI